MEADRPQEADGGAGPEDALLAVASLAAAVPGALLAPRAPSSDRGLVYVALLLGLVGASLLSLSAVLFLGLQFADADVEAFRYRMQFLISGGILLAVAIVIQGGPILEWLSTRLITLNVLLQTVLVALIVGFGVWVASRHYRVFDWTSEKIYSISDETVEVLKKLDKDVQIHLILPGGSQQQLIDALRRTTALYEERSQRVKMIHVDPFVDPRAFDDLCTRAGLSARTEADLIGVLVWAGTYDEAKVWRGERTKHIPAREFFEQQQPRGMGGEERGITFKGEQILTNAILEVTESSRAKVYFLEGQDERELDGQGQSDLGEVAKYLRQKNYEVASLKLLEREKGEVPDDAAAVVIAGPKQPFQPSELMALESYLKRGGHVLAMLSPELKKNDKTGDYEWRQSKLEGLLKKYNVDVQGRILLRYVAVAGGHQWRGEVYGTNLDRTHPITSKLGGYRLVFLSARPLAVLTGNAQAKTTELVKTPENVWISTAKLRELEETGTLPDDVEKKAFTLAVAVEQEVEGALPNPVEKAKKKVTRLVVMGDADWASNRVSDAPGHYEFLYNTMSWLTQTDDAKQRFISQAKKPHSYKLTFGQGTVVLFALLSALWLPTIPVLLGIAVGLLRRSR